MNPLHPKHIDGYEIEGVWAEGGSCTLYLGLNPITHDHVLLKTISPLHKNNKEIADRFLHEEHVLSLCHHANIIKMIAHGSWNEEPFLVLEFIRGASLRKVLQHHPIPLQRALALFLEICSAVGHLHSLGFVHRDLKPENILITDQGLIKLIDFGLASTIQETTAQHIPSNVFYEGTPTYMSPEAIKDHSIKSITRDIYALGILAYEMILGRISSGKVVLASLPKGLQPIIAKAVQPSPQNRYTSVSELIQAVSSYSESNALTQEKQSSDYFFELFEQAEALRKQIHHSLCPREVKESSFSLSSTLERQGSYAATIKQGEEKGFFIAEFSEKGMKGLTASLACHYILQTMRQLYKGTLFDLFSEVQKTLLNQFSVRCCFASIHHSTIHYFLENWGSLFLVQKNPSPIIHPLSSTDSKKKCQVNDTLVFVSHNQSESFTSPSLSVPDMIQPTILETASLPASKQSINILQRLRMKGLRIEEENPVCILSFNCYPENV